MKIKKVNSDAIKLYETSMVKLKTAGNTREVQFMAGNNNRCPIQNISKDKYLDKQTGEIKERKKLSYHRNIFRVMIDRGRAICWDKWQIKLHRI